MTQRAVGNIVPKIDVSPIEHQIKLRAIISLRFALDAHNVKLYKYIHTFNDIHTYGIIANILVRQG